MNQVMKFLKEDDGATAIEYGLIAGLVAVGLILALTTFRTAIVDLFGRIGTQLGAVAPTA